MAWFYGIIIVYAIFCGVHGYGSFLGKYILYHVGGGFVNRFMVVQKCSMFS
jgi:hypothetical protein